MEVNWSEIKQILEGEATADEQAKFDVWLNESPTRRDSFEKIIAYYENTALEEYKNSLHAQKFHAKQITNKVSLRKKVALWSSISAAAIAILFLSFNLFNSSQKTELISEIHPTTLPVLTEEEKVQLITESGEAVDFTTVDRIVGNAAVANDSIRYKSLTQVTEYHTIIVPNGKRAVIELEDGTIVNLNSMSQLRYPNRFTGEENRKVTLTGEGYFKVQPNKEQPFIVTFNGMDVKVYGTEFNVKGYEKNASEVILVNGSVEVFNQQKSLLLKPGEKATLQASTANITKTNVDLYAELAWTRNEFYYENTPIQTVVNDLMRHYNVEIRIESEELLKQSVTLYLSKDRGIDDVMSILGRNETISITKNKTHYLLIKNKL